MNLGRICGRITASVRVAEIPTGRLALVQPVDETGAEVGFALVCIDANIGASEGSLVWFVNGWDAIEALDARSPIDAVVVGLVDEVRT